MSYYARNVIPNEEERPRSSRRTRGARSRENDVDVNSNVNNNNNNSNHDNEVNTKSSSTFEVQKPRKLSGSKSPAPRRKSTLIETMAANFERKNNSEKVTATNTKTIQNGDIKMNHAPATPTQTLQVPGSEDVDDSPTSPQKKVGPSARRGKQQREKRMLRQKRRSTGVVNLKDIDNEEENKGDKKDKNGNDEADLQTETDLNTQNNELSPVQGFCSVSRVTPKKTEVTAPSPNPETNGSYETPTSVVIPHLSSSRMRNSRFKENNDNNSEMEKLRLKLELAETTISKLHQELKHMDDDLHALEEENHKLKQENKMLEDENMTMLRLIRRP
uniref:PRKC apoptosis WT1 regulator protein-like n=1 Tax=Phallusia mammillata TaxID=59560 RepID=A0A6F9DNW5_9ASCI|nr:PRKC apoptosis WT1 regulator protein-like [Phallusia mammillata]